MAKKSIRKVVEKMRKKSPKFALSVVLGDKKFSAKGNKVEKLFAELGISEVQTRSTMTLKSGRKESSIELNVQGLRRAVANSTAVKILVNDLLENLA